MSSTRRQMTTCISGRNRGEEGKGQMTKPRRNRSRPLEEAFVLAAVDRGQRHSPWADRGVPLWVVTDHLGLGRGSGPSQRVRPVLDRLTRERGWLELHVQHDRPNWTVTADGSYMLTQAFPDGADDHLPESPQHKEWREARNLAGRVMPKLRAELSARLDEVHELVGRKRTPTSDEWLALVHPLGEAVRRVGFATYCLHQWNEPADATADVDEEATLGSGRVGRRNYRRWGSEHLGRDR